MSSKARITSEFPSEQEVASRLKLSSGRAAALRKQLYDLHVTHPDGSVTIVEYKRPRSGSKVGSARKLDKPVRSRVAAKKR